MDLYERQVDQEMATESGRLCIWFVVRRRLLNGADERRLIVNDPPRADELAAQRVDAMSESDAHMTGNDATAFVRTWMIERARWQFSTTEIDTLEAGVFATSMLDGFDCGAWD